MYIKHASVSAFLPLAASGYDVDPRLHGNSSGYHSDDASPIKKSEGAPFQEFRMPGMLDSHDDHSRKIVQPSDVVIMVYYLRFSKDKQENGFSQTYKSQLIEIFPTCEQQALGCAIIYLIRKLSTCKKWHSVLIVLQSRTELNKRGVLQTSENPQVSVHEVVLWIPFVLFSIHNHQRFCDGFGGFTECHLSSWRKKRITRLWLIWPTLDAKIFFHLHCGAFLKILGFFIVWSFLFAIIL